MKLTVTEQVSVGCTTQLRTLKSWPAGMRVSNVFFGSREAPVTGSFTIDFAPTILQFSPGYSVAFTGTYGDRLTRRKAAVLAPVAGIRGEAAHPVSNNETTTNRQRVIRLYMGNLRVN